MHTFGVTCVCSKVLAVTISLWPNAMHSALLQEGEISTSRTYEGHARLCSGCMCQTYSLGSIFVLDFFALQSRGPIFFCRSCKLKTERIYLPMIMVDKRGSTTFAFLQSLFERILTGELHRLIFLCSSSFFVASIFNSCIWEINTGREQTSTDCTAQHYLLHVTYPALPPDILMQSSFLTSGTETSLVN